MVTLNTLRVRFGVVLSVIIALALLAFIFSLRNEMGFSSKDPKVGEIAGDKISYSEYYEEYNNIKQQSGNAYDEQSEERVTAAVWQALLTKHAIVPGFEAMGIEVSESERLSMLKGDHMSNVYYQAFANPQTGGYDVNAVLELLSQANNDPQLQQMLQAINSQAVLDRQMTKYVGLVRGGAYVNSLEVENGVYQSNHTYSGKVAGKTYASVPDSLVTVSASEIRSYYNDHKRNYKQQPSRSISYVLFEVDPTQEDMEALETEFRALADEFHDAEDVKGFVRQNRRGVVETAFVGREQLSNDEAEALMAGNMYGPVLERDKWKMARVVESRMLPDSMGLRHVMLPYNEVALADSLLTVLRNGGNIAQIAADYSVAQTAAMGGELGVMPYSMLPQEFADALATAKKGDKVKVVAGNAIHLVEVYKVGNVSKHVNVARIEYPVEASSATKTAVKNTASVFAVDANGSLDKFHAAANGNNVTERVATLYNGQRTIGGLDRSHEVVQWAFGADKGDVSDVFKVGEDYVVAVLTGIDDAEYRSLESVQNDIKRELLNDKKFEHIVAGVDGSTIESVAESLGTDVSEFGNLTYSLYYVPGSQMLPEPRLVGAIASTEQTGVLSAPVKGSAGVYYFTVDEISESGEQTADAERVRRQSMAEVMAQQASIFVIQELANVKNLSGRYF